MVIYKFLQDVDRCIDCGGCFAACKDKNEVPEGTARIRVIKVGEGKPGERMVAMACMHCAVPACVRACPVKAISKRPDGIVINDKSKCIGCGYCGWACPFGAPKYPDKGPAELVGIMDKCTFCTIPFEQEKDAAGNLIQREPKPACVSFCATKARLGGDVTEITKIYTARKAGRLARTQVGV
ncbi:MAG: 4Fe-4S dicluster domain-containing protein [Candidatus Methanospirareceae archaeon]